MNFFKYISTLLILFILSCAGSKNDGELTLQDKFMDGMTNLDKEKYLQAQIDFKHIVIRGTGSELGDDAQYYLAESFFRNKEYLLAVSEYEKLTRRMGFSPFVEDARFKICEAYRIESPKYYHDQEYTEKSLQRYQEFLDDFPNSKFNNEVLASIENLREKLGKKLYETGILYMKMDEYESAEMAFQRTIELYYDTKILNQARQGKIRAINKNNKLEDASRLLEEFKISLELEGLYEETKKDLEKEKDKLSRVSK